MRAGLAVAVACVAVLSGCSDDGDRAPETTFSLGPAECAVADDPVLMVDEIDAAVAAVEAELGGEQVYFEINATPLLVNLFVADPVAEDGHPVRVRRRRAVGRGPAARGVGVGVPGVGAGDRSAARAVVHHRPAARQRPRRVLRGGQRRRCRAVHGARPPTRQGGQLTIEVTGAGLVLAVDAI